MTFTGKQSAIALLFVFVAFCFLSNEDFNTKQADEAYRLQVVAQRKAAQKKAAHDKAFNDLAARGEFMTGFKAAMK